MASDPPAEFSRVAAPELKVELGIGKCGGGRSSRPNGADKDKKPYPRAETNVMAPGGT